MQTPKYLHYKALYDAATTEIEKIDCLNEMALELRNEDVERSLEMANDMIKRSKDIDYRKGLGYGYNHKGACYWLMGEYEDGLDELTAAFSIAREIGDKSLEARATNNFGRIYRELGDLSNALRHFEIALDINEQLGDVLNQTINLTNISNLYYDLSDYDTALEYALKCLPIFEENEDWFRLANIYNILGNIYYKKENFQESLGYFIKNYNVTEETTPARALANSGLGKVYLKMQDFDKAIDYLELSLSQSIDLGNYEGEIAARYYLGCLHMEQGIYRKALTYFDAALKLAEETLRRHDLMSIHEKLSILHDYMSNIPKAFQHLKTYEKLKEEIFQQATLNKLRNLQVKNQIEVAKKEKEVAIRTAQLKQQFMANMSHEIRTPMNAIVGITRLLLDKSPRPDQEKYLNVIKQSADNLLVIINDILDLSKIEANKIVIEHVDFSLRELISSAKEIMRVKAEEKGLDFQVEVQDSIPDRLIGDPTRLNQIMINLIGNAVKFTEQGLVQLQCKCESQEDGIVKLNFKVIDTGMGISKEYVDKIFESFTQAGTDTARKYGGTGLGLTISKQLVDLMNGKIKVESEVNKGTTFTVTLPFEIAKNQKVTVRESKVTPAVIQQLNKAHILLVEDNEFNRLVAEDTLKEILKDIRIDVAENGEIAIQKLKHQDYDLILMDIQMPVMDGVSATRYIRSQMSEGKKDTKIIAMTANVLQQDVQLYLKEGMNAYVSKPFQTEELLLKMSKVMGLVSDAEVVENKESQNGTTMEFLLPETVTDMQFLIQFTGGKEDKRNKYIHMFLENGPKLLTQINDAIAKKDFPSLKIAAHSLKPQLSYMGVKEESSNIYLIEHTASEGHEKNLVDLIAHLNKVCAKAFEELKAIVG